MIAEMLAGATAAALACPHCSGPVDVKSPHVAVTGSAIRVYCSEECLHGIGEQTVEIYLEDAGPKRRAGWLIAAGLALGAGAIVLVIVKLLTRKAPPSG